MNEQRPKGPIVNLVPNSPLSQGEFLEQVVQRPNYTIEVFVLNFLLS